ncbi:beta-glucosidase [Jeotgalibacillus malaysiensis]|uniref:Beta-glucosidase n=1 Tax=Jeotgalibacillus malaysiensis TaxID=1508404 RepID=A0A0B5ARU7_9BACL|nr:GH1 family beta-glucosidase [Jeotgalibacillus malaysiensis]AJD92791.1 beta-glucosidase [Jeotgalibacillus malaysiensis]
MRKFPEHFVWGTATSSFQIEGGRESRGESIWDQFCKNPGKVLNGDHGEVACDHINRYKEDVQLMKDLNVPWYRFSISWSRIFPNGDRVVNEEGLQFYDNLLTELEQQGIKPAVTLYHWDLPQALQDKGGWMNRDIVEEFAHYCDVIFDCFGDRVSNWITHNEPWVVSWLGYGSGEHAPGYRDIPGFLKAAHHVLLSHGVVVKRFRERGLQGEIGITLNLNSSYPFNENASSVEAAVRWDGFLNRWFLDPVFKGQYPADMLEHYSVYTDFSFVKEGDLDTMSAAVDFLGINYYSISYLTHQPGAWLEAGHEGGGHRRTSMGWEVYAKGLSDLLIRLKNDYDNPVIYVTENGAAYDDEVTNGEVHDPERVQYLQEHLDACLDAIDADVDLRGYFAWSFLDNFEWAFGYCKRFGLVYVDFETQQRIPKESAKWFQQVILNNGLKIQQQYT